MGIAEAEPRQSLDYSGELIRVLESAQKTAQGHIGTADLLLGVSKEPSAKSILDSLGIKVDAVLNPNMPSVKNSERSRQIELSARAKSAMKFAAIEARSDGSDKVKLKHVIAGIIRECKNSGVKAIENHSGKTTDNLLAELKTAH